MPPTSYLGDSVYCTYEHGGYSLFLNNGERGLDGSPVQKSLIVLEPEVLTALITFFNKQNTTK